MAPGLDHTDTDALLVAYLDGELEPERRRELEQRLRSDASLRAHLTALADATELLRTSIDALLEEAPRARLYAAFAAALSKSPPGARNINSASCS